MAIPQVSLTIADNSLGILGEQVDGVHVKIGVSSAGAQNTLLAFSDVKTLRDTLGEGPLVEAIATALNTSVRGKSPRPIYAMRVSPSTVGTSGSTTTTRIGSSTGTVAASGAAYDTYAALVEVTRTGTLGTGAFRYSLDGGDVYSSELAIPGSGTYVIPGTNVTLTFAANGGPTYFEDGDLFSFATTAPYYSTSDLATTMTALFADPREWEFVHLVGAPGGANDAAKVTAFVTVATAMSTHMSTAEAAGRYVWALLEVPDITNDGTGDAALINGTTSLSGVRIAGGAGYSEMISAINGRVYRRPDAWVYAARVAAIPISEDPLRVQSGPVSGIVTLGRDEERRPGLDAARFVTLRKYLGDTSGPYVTRGRMLAPAGSDFDIVQNRRVMDRACRVARTALRQFLGENYRVNPVTASPAPGEPGAPGTLDERDARTAEAYVQAQLEAALLAPGHVSAVAVQCNRSDNFLSTRTLRATIRVTPLGYVHAIEAEIAFLNPALAAAVAPAA